MVVGVSFDKAGQQQQQPCILALPWFLPVAPSITIPLPPYCKVAFASLDLPSSSSSSSIGPIVGSHLRLNPFVQNAGESVTIEFDADVEVGE
jgi:hypothetical protein